MENGRLPAYAFPGGYPIYYLSRDNGVLCPECANDYKKGRDNEEQLKPVEVDINYENDSLYCDNCGRRVESAYAEDETTKDQQS